MWCVAEEPRRLGPLVAWPGPPGGAYLEALARALATGDPGEAAGPGGACGRLAERLAALVLDTPSIHFIAVPQPAVHPWDEYGDRAFARMAARLPDGRVVYAVDASPSVSPPAVSTVFANAGIAVFNGVAERGHVLYKAVLAVQVTGHTAAWRVTSTQSWPATPEQAVKLVVPAGAYYAVKGRRKAVAHGALWAYRPDYGPYANKVVEVDEAVLPGGYRVTGDPVYIHADSVIDGVARANVKVAAADPKIEHPRAGAAHLSGYYVIEWMHAGKGRAYEAVIDGSTAVVRVVDPRTGGALDPFRHALVRVP